MLSRKWKVKTVLFIAAAFVTMRTFGYETGIITSDRFLAPFPVYVWTVIFGSVLGWVYVILYPVYSRGSNRQLLSFKLCILTIGINWIIFNSFIGFIFAGTMPQMLLRSSMDVLSLFISSVLLEKSRRTDTAM